ncbi:MAG: DUF4126 domain-containing protein [Desulfuromusa sp.]
MLINASPEPFTNWFASLSEDALVIAGLWTAFHYPLLFIVLLAVFIVLMIWLLPKIWRGVKWMLVALKNFLTGSQQEPILSLNFEIPAHLSDKNSKS